MTSLAQTALDFCRECLAWDAVVWGGDERVMIWDQREGGDSLPFTDLNAVKAAVQKWCDENDAAVEIGYYGAIPGEWEVLLIPPSSIDEAKSVPVQTIQSDDLCHALLAACAQTARKLKESA